MKPPTYLLINLRYSRYSLTSNLHSLQYVYIYIYILYTYIYIVLILRRRNEEYLSSQRYRYFYSLLLGEYWSTLCVQTSTEVHLVSHEVKGTVTSTLYYYPVLLGECWSTFGVAAAALHFFYSLLLPCTTRWVLKYIWCRSRCSSLLTGICMYMYRAHTAPV